jgi:hypothetical protein
MYLHYVKVTKAANETHADCLHIIIRAESRIADEVDRGQVTRPPETLRQAPLSAISTTPLTAASWVTEDHSADGRGRRQAARPESKREVADARDCPRGTRQSATESGQAEAGLWQIAGRGRSGGGQAKRFSREIGEGVKRCKAMVRQAVLESQRQALDAMVPRLQQVMRQTKARIFLGDTRSENKIVSLFEPSTEVIRKGKASKPTEFGKLVKLQEAENQLVIDYEVYAQRPNDADLLIPAIAAQAKLGRIPRLVAADAGFYSTENEIAAHARGVKRVCIPNRSSKSAARKLEQKKRWLHWRRRTEVIAAKTEQGVRRFGPADDPLAQRRHLDL